MTDDRMALLELIEKRADADLVRELLGFAADRLMEAEVQCRTGAGLGERDPPPAGTAQRLSPARLGNPGGSDRPRDPEAASRQLLPLLSGLNALRSTGGPPKRR